MKYTIIVGLLLTGGCSQFGNNENSFGLVWVAKGTSATLTINAQATTKPDIAPIPVIPVVPAGVPTLIR